MKKYLNANELMVNFKINRLVKMQKLAVSIGGSPDKYKARIKSLENQLRRD